MASKTGINISGHYIVSLTAMFFRICTLNSRTLKGQTRQNYIVCFQNSTTMRHDVLISDYVIFIPTAVSSN